MKNFSICANTVMSHSKQKRIKSVMRKHTQIRKSPTSVPTVQKHLPFTLNVGNTCFSTEAPQRENVMSVSLNSETTAVWKDIILFTREGSPSDVPSAIVVSSRLATWNPTPVYTQERGHISVSSVTKASITIWAWRTTSRNVTKPTLIPNKKTWISRGAAAQEHKPNLKMNKSAM